MRGSSQFSDETSQVSLVQAVAVGSWRQSSDINYNQDSQIYSIKIMNITFLTFKAENSNLLHHFSC